MTDQTVTDAVCAVFDAGAEAWNRGDLDRYLETYLNSDDLRVVYNMMIMRGKQAIVDMNKSQFTTHNEMGTLHIKQIEVEAIGAEDALAFGIMERVGGKRPVTATFTAHVRKIDGTWRIFSEHGAV